VGLTLNYGALMLDVYSGTVDWKPSLCGDRENTVISSFRRNRDARAQLRRRPTSASGRTAHLCLAEAA